jgi:UDP-N-acetylglucosamine 2-epimerase (non-hydrolysing)
MHKALTGKWKKGGIPDLWDGNTSERIVKHLMTVLKLKVQLYE